MRPAVVNALKAILCPLIQAHASERKTCKRCLKIDMGHLVVFNQVVMMLNKALKKIPNNTNLILHSDQGWQYQMKNYQNRLKEKGIIQSMSRKGNCLDNAIIENFFGILKSELFYLKKYTSISQLKIEIKEYINYYNNDRRKSNLNKMSPIQYRAHYHQN